MARTRRDSRAWKNKKLAQLLWVSAEADLRTAEEELRHNTTRETVPLPRAAWTLIPVEKSTAAPAPEVAHYDLRFSVYAKIHRTYSPPTESDDDEPGVIIRF